MGLLRVSYRLGLLKHGAFRVENLQPRNNSGHPEHVVDSLANSDESQATRLFGQELLSTDYFTEPGAVQCGHRREVEHNMRLLPFPEAINVLSQLLGGLAEGEWPIEIQDRHITHDTFSDDHSYTRHHWSFLL